MRSGWGKPRSLEAGTTEAGADLPSMREGLGLGDAAGVILEGAARAGARRSPAGSSAPAAGAGPFRRGLRRGGGVARGASPLAPAPIVTRHAANGAVPTSGAQSATRRPSPLRGRG
ncbi:MAG: hypothetical protein AAF715_29090 [Myxococcota bacterium]